MIDTRRYPLTATAVRGISLWMVELNLLIRRQKNTHIEWEELRLRVKDDDKDTTWRLNLRQRQQHESTEMNRCKVVNLNIVK